MEHIDPQPADHHGHLARFEKSLADVERYYKTQDSQNITMGYFAEAARYSLQLPFFRTLADDMYHRHPGLEDAYAYNRLSRSFQDDALRHYPHYPDGFQSRDGWVRQIEEVEQDAQRQHTIWHNAVDREIQSNVAERYKSVKLLVGLLADRFDHHPHHLDVGSSVMHGDLKMVFANVFNDLNFGNIEIVSQTDTAEKPTRNEYLSRLANIALRQNVEFGAVAGIDITNIDDEAVREWVRACSFYPDELRDHLRVNEYDLLDHIDRDHERVGFFRGDFSSNHDVRKFRDVSPVARYDVITFSTIFYQLSRTQQTSMIVNALNLLSPDGIIITQDAPDGNFAKKYNYLTSVIDATDAGLESQTILRWENGRCQRAKIEDGKLGALGMRLTLIELLEHYNA